MRCPHQQHNSQSVTASPLPSLCTSWLALASGLPAQSQCSIHPLPYTATTPLSSDTFLFSPGGYSVQRHRQKGHRSQSSRDGPIRYSLKSVPVIHLPFQNHARARRKADEAVTMPVPFCSVHLESSPK